MDLGLKAAGFKIVASIEMDSDCCDTLRANFDHKIIEKRVEDVSSAELARLKNIDLIAGGPPCQPFSKSAMWTNKAAQGLADDRADSLKHYFSCVERVQPRAFLLENVEGFVARGGIAFVQERLRVLASKGLEYNLDWKVLDAADFGVPQHRRRLIAVGTRADLEFRFPEPTHGTLSRPFFTAWDAIAPVNEASDEDLNLRGRWAELVPSIPVGKNYLWHTSRGGGLPLFGWRTRYWSFLLKLDASRPAPTLVANPSQNSGPFHWCNRLLSIGEMSAIQTFPTAFKYVGSAPSQRRQLGNAVPPLLGEILGQSIAKSLGKKRQRALVHVPTRAAAPPQLPAVSTVAAKYLSLIGDHEEHPGTGLGPKPRSIKSRAKAQPALQADPKIIPSALTV